MSMKLLHWCLLMAVFGARAQNIDRRLGRFQEVFAWKQMTYNVNGNLLLSDRFSDEDLAGRVRRQADEVFFDNGNERERNWSQSTSSSGDNHEDRNSRKWNSQSSNNQNSASSWNRPNRPQDSTWTSQPFINQRPSQVVRTTTSTTARPVSEEGRFFIQYNNVPMGMEKVGSRLFVSLPRRRYGIPATLNYIDLTRESNNRSPPLTPYPDIWMGRNLTSVYRTRADECGRLWMVDTGLMELPNNPRQIQPPAIVVFDLNTDSQILRYQFKSTDIPAANTPTGLASITVDIVNGDCSNAFAYVPDLTTFGIIVFSLRERDSWRLSHNYFSFSPTAGNLNIAGHRFQWSDGIFSITLNEPDRSGCRTAYFHPLISTQEFSVSTCVLRNKTASTDSNYFLMYSLVGDRGIDSQCTMHGYHAGTGVIFFADIGRNAVSCWRTANPLNPANVGVLAQDSQRMSYPADLHVTGDEVWVIANTLPRFGYSRLDPQQYNFYIYRGNVNELIAGTVCGDTLGILG